VYSPSVVTKFIVIIDSSNNTPGKAIRT
jgi:hypothetical protein